MTFTPLFPEDARTFSVCFVCTGNICRSPMAEVVLRDLAVRAGLEDVLVVSSAGTGEWHVGEPADSRTLDALRKSGYDGDVHRARQFDPAWFADLDLVVVLDRGQERILRSWAADPRDRDKVRRLLGFDNRQSSTGDVPDPYYSDARMFDAVLGMIEAATTSLFRQIEPALRSSTAPIPLPTAPTNRLRARRGTPETPAPQDELETGDSTR